MRFFEPLPFFCRLPLRNNPLNFKLFILRKGLEYFFIFYAGDFGINISAVGKKIF